MPDRRRQLVELAVLVSVSTPQAAARLDPSIHLNPSIIDALGEFRVRDARD